MSQPTPPAGKPPYAQNRGSSPSPWRLGSSSSVKLRLSRSCKVVQGFFFVVGFLVWLSFAWTSSQNEQLKKQLENSNQRLEELNEQVTSSLHRMSDLSRIIMRADEVDRRQRKARRLRRFSGDDERKNISSSSSASSSASAVPSASLRSSESAMQSGSGAASATPALATASVST